MTELANLYANDAAVGRPMVQVWLRAGGPLLPGASATAELFAETIRFGQHQGDIDPKVDPVIAGKLLLDAYLGILYRWSTQERGQPRLADAMATMVRLVLDGIGSA